MSENLDNKVENKEKYPYSLGRIHGPFEEITIGIGLTIGVIVGWTVGSDIVEYINQLQQSSDILATTIRDYPFTTKLISAFIGGEVVSSFSRYAGKLVDHMFGTYH